MLRFVHGIEDRLFGMDIGDEDVHDLIAVLAHGLSYGLQDLCHHLLLGFVALVEGHGGHGRPQDVVHFGSDLIVRAGDVECCHLHHVFEDSVLHGRHRNNCDIVLGLAVRLAGELVHGQGDTRDGRARPANAAAARLLQALVLPELLNHADGPCVDARKAAARHGFCLEILPSRPAQALETSAS